jgi:hypothetical protein
MELASSTNHVLSTTYGQFIYMEGCRQHACPSSWLKIIYDPIKDKIAVLIFDENQGSFMVGDKSTEMRIVLKDLQKQ